MSYNNLIKIQEKHPDFPEVTYSGYVSDIKYYGSLPSILYNTDNCIKCSIEVNRALENYYSNFELKVFGEESTNKFWRYKKQLNSHYNPIIYRHTLQTEIQSFNPNLRTQYSTYNKLLLLSDLKDSGNDCGIQAHITYTEGRIQTPNNTFVGTYPGNLYGQLSEVVGTSLLYSGSLSVDDMIESILKEFAAIIDTKMLPKFNLTSISLYNEIYKYLLFTYTGK